MICLKLDTRTGSFQVDVDATPPDCGVASINYERKTLAVPGTWNTSTNYADSRYQLPQIDIVSLIIAAQIFAKGLQSTGLIDALISGAQHLGLGIGAMAIIFTLIVGCVTFLTGSGVGPFSAFAKLAPEIAEGVGGQATAIVTPMQFASGLFRSMSPISGVVIAVALSLIHI